MGGPRSTAGRLPLSLPRQPVDSVMARSEATSQPLRSRRRSRPRRSRRKLSAPAGIFVRCEVHAALGQPATVTPPTLHSAATAFGSVAPSSPEVAEPTRRHQLRGISGPMRWRTRSTISPGAACRPSAFFEKMRSPSSDTSKRPLDDGMSSMFSMIGAQPLRSWSAKLTARGT